MWMNANGRAPPWGMDHSVAQRFGKGALPLPRLLARFHEFDSLLQSRHLGAQDEILQRRQGKVGGSAQQKLRCDRDGGILVVLVLDDQRPAADRARSLAAQSVADARKMEAMAALGHARIKPANRGQTDCARRVVVLGGGAAEAGIALRCVVRRKHLLQKKNFFCSPRPARAVFFGRSIFKIMRGLSVAGRGVDVLFASGLCNTMPSTAYSRFLSNMQRHMRVWCYDAGRPLDADTLSDIADAIGAESIGYVGHSSLVPSILQSPRLSRIVLLDPAALPCGVDVPSRRLVSRRLRVDKPVCVLNAEYTSGGGDRFVPDGFDLQIDEVAPTIHKGVGHADVLDDFAADSCRRLGIRGTADGLTRLAYQTQLSCAAVRWLTLRAPTA